MKSVEGQREGAAVSGSLPSPSSSITSSAQLLSQPPCIQPQQQGKQSSATDAPVTVKRSPATPGAATGQARVKAGLDKPAGMPDRPEALKPPEILLPPTQPSPVGKLVVAAAAVILGLCGGAVYFWKQPGKQELACNTSMSEASMKVAAGNISSARRVAADLVSRCGEPVKSQATELLAALDRQQQASQADCDRKFRQIDSQITDRRIVSARNSLDQLDATCTDLARANDLRQKVATNLTTASNMEAQVRSDLAEGRHKEAKARLDQLRLLNREHPDLVGLDTAIAAAIVASQQTAPSATAIMAATGPAVKPPPPPAIVAAPAPAVQPPVTVSSQADLTSAFLKDAEQALMQRRFDAARTFIESVRRIDPNNVPAASLLRRIKDQELQYLKEETSIK